ncbi:MAG: aldehyde dehydrogenase [Betaproteobacteria bacterium]|nr:aldehyde dehydrogenase [Betaproteobacteria bacterium]
MQTLKNFINGQFTDPLSKRWLDVENPARGRIYAQCPNSDAADISLAVEAARRSFPAWKALGEDKRAAYLLKVADILEKRMDEFAEAESRDQGKPVSLARSMDISRATANFRFFATRLQHTEEKAFKSSEHVLHYTERSPLGVVGLITPWNLPLYLLTWKIAPAIAFGNTVVCKPSEITPLTAFMLCDVLNEAGLPPGVVNMVFGDGPSAGQALVEHKNVRAISFTGGTKTGAHLATTAAPLFKKLSLELGGKNPNIIFEDADLATAVQVSVRSSFLNQGEICLCGSRIYVQKSVYEKFLEGFVEQTKKFKVGDPSHSETRMGALVSASHLAKVDSYVKLAVADGGRILCGGKRARLEGECAHGYFYEPTILVNVPHHSRAIQEEIFGPVVTVTPFETEAEAIALANEPEYGLSASLWTENLSRAHRVARAVEAGIVWVNGWLLRDLRVPFGGMKASGLGREGGDWSHEFYTETKDICIQLRHS